MVEIDDETGEVTLLRYVAVDDVGKVINPMIVDGQVHGGIAQGVAQALWEGSVYDENGQLETASMMDYAVPKAEFFPSFEVDRTETPTDVNPLGVKGAGETGTIASTPAVVNAVMDALAPLGITHLDMPLTPERVWRAMQAGEGLGGARCTRCDQPSSRTTGRRASTRRSRFSARTSRPIAGGHSLLPIMKLRLATPAALVDIGRVPGLDGISQENGGVAIGALATHAQVAGSKVMIGIAPVIPETAALIGDAQVRNRGTIGGSVAHADPAADYPTVLKALGATITATGKGGEREIAADDFFRGIFTTALETDELVTSVNVPATPAGTGAAYVKHRHPASFYAVVGVAAVVSVEGGKCTAARITIGGVTSPPVHATAAAESLVGSSGDADAIAAAAAQVPRRARRRDRRQLRVGRVPRPPGGGAHEAGIEEGLRANVVD